MALISLEDVSKIYPRGTRPALDGINLDIERGDFVFLVGASGSGKTTLLSLLLREEEATSGEIRVAGNDLRRIPNRQVPHYRRTLGFVFQDYKLLNNKTVWENVAFALEVIGTRRSTIKSLVPKVLDTVGLTGKERNYPHELSGGEQQRVAIARAYVNHPQILLADEPTGNLDPTTSLGIMEVLDAINRTGTTIVMATHNEEIVNSMRKRVVELHNGKIVRDEANGSYDSALYFPDAEVEARSEQASHILPASFESDKSLAQEEGPSAGIARLANSVHSGRTGRYGETFAPLEDTLTWGKGLPLDQQADHTDGQSDGPSGQTASAAVPASDHRTDEPTDSADHAGSGDSSAGNDADRPSSAHLPVAADSLEETQTFNPVAVASGDDAADDSAAESHDSGRSNGSGDARPARGWAAALAKSRDVEADDRPTRTDEHGTDSGTSDSDKAPDEGTPLAPPAPPTPPAPPAAGQRRVGRHAHRGQSPSRSSSVEADTEANVRADASSTATDGQNDQQEPKHDTEAK